MTQTLTWLDSTITEYIELNNSKIENMQTQLEHLSDFESISQNFLDSSIWAVGNQLTMVSTIFAIVWIFFSIWLKNIIEKVKKADETISKKEEEIKKTQSKIEHARSEILIAESKVKHILDTVNIAQNNVEKSLTAVQDIEWWILTWAYEKIEEAEIKNLFETLLKEPNHINRIYSLLDHRNIKAIHKNYDIWYNASKLWLLNSSEREGINYISLLFKYFFWSALSEIKELKEFKNHIEKSEIEYNNRENCYNFKELIWYWEWEIIDSLISVNKMKSKIDNNWWNTFNLFINKIYKLKNTWLIEWIEETLDKDILEKYKERESKQEEQEVEIEKAETNDKQ